MCLLIIIQELDRRIHPFVRKTRKKALDIFQIPGRQFREGTVARRLAAFAMDTGNKRFPAKLQSNCVYTIIKTQ